MKLVRAFAVIGLAGAMLCGISGSTRAEPSMTLAYKEYLKQVASKNGMAFVSGCAGPDPGETEILIIPLGSRSGDLATLAGHDVSNRVGIRFEVGKPTLTEQA